MRDDVVDEGVPGQVRCEAGERSRRVVFTKVNNEGCTSPGGVETASKCLYLDDGEVLRSNDTPANHARSLKRPSLAKHRAPLLRHAGRLGLRYRYLVAAVPGTRGKVSIS